MGSILEQNNFRHFMDAVEKTDRPRIAIFDCDGTMIKGDVGEAMLYYQIEHFLFRQSPGEIWTDHPGRELLQQWYLDLLQLPPVERKSSPGFEKFAGAILDWYFGQIEDGKVAKACADIVRLFAGFTISEARDIAQASFDFEHHAKISERSLGGRILPLGIRYLAESLELLRKLQKEKFDIWVISGSNKWSVEPVFAPLGVPRDRVIGIEMIEEHGILTSREVLPVPIRADKIEAFRRRSELTPLLVASDSRNDLPLLRRASMLKVRINSRGRSTEEFFRDVPKDENGSWVNVEKPTVVEDGIPH
ncbi:MAG TPA: haloacid dehalogenase-like hydrolase [Bacteroidota bacterium]|nr:haloacid dehalogenase-like hydrolase [Bacteroidota bacterium]